jgi:hypothetical protein
MYIRPELISGGSAPKSMSIPDFLVDSLTDLAMGGVEFKLATQAQVSKATNE